MPPEGRQRRKLGWEQREVPGEVWGRDLSAGTPARDTCLRSPGWRCHALWGSRLATLHLLFITKMGIKTLALWGWALSNSPMLDVGHS